MYRYIMRSSAVRFAAVLAVFAAAAAAAAAAATLPLKLQMNISPQSEIQPGKRLTIDCAFEPVATYIFWRFSINNGATWDKLALCHADSGKCSLQEQFKNWTDRLSTLVNGSLTLLNVSKEQDGLYECEGIRNTDAAKDNRSVVVITPPKQPVVTPASTSDRTVLEGSRLSLTCRSDGGNPPPQLKWLMRRRNEPDFAQPDAKLSPQVSWRAAADKFGSTEASVSLLLTAADNLAEVACQTVHPLGNSTSAAVLIEVLYAPKLVPVESQRVIVGSSVTFNCTADSNPTAVLTLQKDNVTVAEAPQATLLHTKSSTTRFDSGNFFCLAWNSIGSARRDFSLAMLFPPAVEAPGSLTVREGASLLADCFVTSEPLPFTVNWRHASSGRLLGNASRLDIRSASRTDAGEWTCEAQNLMTPTDRSASSRTGRGSAAVQVTVQYPPGMPVIGVTSGSANTQAGSRMELECRPSLLSPGVPAPQFTWTMRTAVTTKTSSGSSLTLAAASLDDSGEYVCSAENSVGRGPAASVSVTVEQPPRWLDNAVDGESTTTTTSIGDDRFALICAVRGRPACEVAWTRDGRELDLGAYSVTSEFDPNLFVTKSSLRFSGPSRSALRPEDNGAYVCAARNAHGKISRTYSLVVEFAPTIQTSLSKLALDPSASDASLECEILAQPKPEVTWEVGSNSYVSNISQDPALSYKHRATLFGVRSLGRYTCLARNALGEVRHSIDVVARGPPDAPTAVRLLGTPAWDRVSLSWQPGFDGGLPAAHWLRCNPPPEGRTLEERIRVDSDRSASAANLTGLSPGTNYSVTVFAVNQLGAGPAAAELRFTTPTLTIPSVTGLRRDGSSTATLLLDAWPSGYCLKAEATSLTKSTSGAQSGDSSEAPARQWHPVQLQQLAQCQPLVDNRLTGLDLTTMIYRFALCLADRTSVCGAAVTTESVSSFPEVSSLTIIIVASFCTLLIIGLVAILVFFCCRHRPTSSASKQAASAASMAEGAGATGARSAESDSPEMRRNRLRRQLEPDLTSCTYKSFSGSKPYALVSPHPSLTSTDETSIEQTNKVFSTLLSANHPIAGNNNFESGSDNSGTVLHPARHRKVIYEVVV